MKRPPARQLLFSVYFLAIWVQRDKETFPHCCCAMLVTSCNNTNPSTAEDCFAPITVIEVTHITILTYCHLYT